MKRYCNVFAVITAMLVTVAGCGAKLTTSEPLTLTAYKIDVSDSDAIMPFAPEYPLWANTGASFDEPTAPQTLQVEFNGVQYTGVYDRSRIDLYESYRKDRYEIDGRIGFFDVNAETQELTDITLVKLEETDNPVPPAEWQATAMQVAARYIDTASYTVEFEEKDSFNFAYFRRNIRGIEAMDYMAVLINKTGTVHGFHSTMLGSLDPEKVESTPADKTKVEALLSTQGDKALSNEAASICSEMKNASSYKTTYQAEEKFFVRLEDGEIGLVCSVEFERVIPDVESVTVCHDLVNVLIK